MADRDTPDVTVLTVQLLSVYLTNNPVASNELADLVRSTRAALSEDVSPLAPPSSVLPSTPVSTEAAPLSGPSVARGKRSLRRSAPVARNRRGKITTTAPTRADDAASSAAKMATAPDAGPVNAPSGASTAPDDTARPDTSVKTPTAKSNGVRPNQKKPAKAKSANSSKSPGRPAPAAPSPVAATLGNGTPSKAHTAAEDALPAAKPLETAGSTTAGGGEQLVTSGAAAPGKANGRRGSAAKSTDRGTATGASPARRRGSAGSSGAKTARKAVKDDQSASGQGAAAAATGTQSTDRTASDSAGSARAKAPAKDATPKPAATPSKLNLKAPKSQPKTAGGRGKLSLFSRGSVEAPNGNAVSTGQTAAAKDTTRANGDSPKKAAKPKRMARTPGGA